MANDFTSLSTMQHPIEHLLGKQDADTPTGQQEPSQHTQHAVKQALHGWQRPGSDQQTGAVLRRVIGTVASWLVPQLLREVTPLHGGQDALRGSRAVGASSCASMSLSQVAQTAPLHREGYIST